MSKDARKGKAPERLPDLIPLGRAPTRLIKSTTKLEKNDGQGPLTPGHDTASLGLQDMAVDLQPPMKKVRINIPTGSSNSAPSTPPRIKTEETTLRSALRKVPGGSQQQIDQKPSPQSANRPATLWTLNRNAKIEQETSQLNPRQVDEEVHNTFSSQSWQEPPPVQHVRAALQYLKSNALKPDPVITNGLLRLGKAMPALLRDQTITTMMIQMLLPDFTHSFKIRTNGTVVFLICALLHLAWDEIDDWPTDFVMAYLEDALGERSWCAQADTSLFVGNVLTAFRTDDVNDEAEDKRLDSVRLDDKSGTSAVMATIDVNQYTGSLSVRKRYRDRETRNLVKQVTLETMWEYVPTAVGGSAIDSTVRSLIKVMMATSRWPEVRLRAMECMEFWLGGFVKIAKPLLRLILREISSQQIMTSEDLEAWRILIDFRYKGRSHQVETVKEELRFALSGLNGQELIRIGLNHITSAEMNPNELKNPYHLDLMDLFLQAIPDRPAVEFGHLIQGCTVDAAFQMVNNTPVSPPLAPVVLLAKRWIRHLGKRSMSWNADVVVGLLTDGPHYTRLVQKQELGTPTNGRNAGTLWLQVVTEIICCVMMATAIEARESEEIKMSKFSVGHAHAFTLQWFQAMIAGSGNSSFTNDPATDSRRTPFGVVSVDALRICLTRLLFLDPPQSYALDSSSQEFDLSLIFKLVENGLPLTETALVAIMDTNLPPKLILNLIGQYVARAADLSRFYADSCIVRNPDVVVKLFNLSRFCETSNEDVLEIAREVPLAWSQSFWTCCLVVVMLSSCNPRILALIVWDSMPVIRTLLEMCVSQHYSFPPPNYTSHSDPSAERLLRNSIQADQADRDCVLSWEKRALVLEDRWDASKQGPVTLSENESEYVGWLMRLDFGPSQPPRAPPADVLQQLRSMNERYGLGMKLAATRDPDYLGRMVGANDDATWIDRLLRDVPEILNALPASTLCARYCRSIASQVAESKRNSDAGGSAGDVAADFNVRRKLGGYLDSVMDMSAASVFALSAQDPKDHFQEVRDIFEFFLVRLCPPSTSSEVNSRRSTSVILETKAAMEALFQGDFKWSTVLLQTVRRTYHTGFLSKVLEWIETIVSEENDPKWIQACLEFLLKVECHAGNQDMDQALEQSLLSVARFLLQRTMVSDWLVRDRTGPESGLILRALNKRLEMYFARQDSAMEDVSQEPVSRTPTNQRPKVRVQLRGGAVLSTFPEILWLSFLVMSFGDINKQDGSIWSMLLNDCDGQSLTPKRLVDGSPLLSMQPPLRNDIALRVRQIQSTQEPAVVRIMLDGLSAVQVLEIAKDGFGLQFNVAQIEHEILAMVLDRESESNVPTYLEPAATRHIMVLLKYYAEQGGQSSARALEALKSRLGNAKSNKLLPSGHEVNGKQEDVLPDFFSMEC